MIGYSLDHDSIIEEDGMPVELDRKHIGVFLTLPLAFEAKQRYKTISGFCDYTEGFCLSVVDIIEDADWTKRGKQCSECFSIDYVDFDNDLEFYIAFFTTRTGASEALDQLRMRTPFSANARNLSIGQHVYNQCHWQEGFVRDLMSNDCADDK